MATPKPLNKPLLVLISGASGAGKSTLASKLAKSLGLFHIERDKLKFGVEFTLKSEPKDRVTTVIPRYLSAVEELLKLQISCIADGTLFAGVSEAQHAGYADIATVINLHCNAADSVERKTQWRKDLQQRVEQGGEQLVEYEPGYFRPLKRSVDDATVAPLDHGFEVLEIDTSDGYEPSFDAVLEWVRGRAK